MTEKALEDTTLTLFFTGGVSLKTWADVGNLDREVAIYKKLSEHLSRVNFVTYGGIQDRAFSNQLGDVRLLPVEWRSKQKYTMVDLLSRHFREIQNTDILKTNQIPGSEIPVWLKRNFKKKLIVRCGYLHSFFIKQQSQDKRQIDDAIHMERTAFSAADMGIVTSPWQRDIVVKEYDIEPSKIRVVPNYVMTDVFQPYPDIERRYDLVYAGRGGAQKNLDNLLKALHCLKAKGKNVSLLMIGGCSNDRGIRDTVDRHDLNVTFAGSVPNLNLPSLLNQAKVFILPSYYEGHPKTLLEAMSCGLPCIGCDVTGIKEDIEHRETGYLCNTDFESIANAIETILSDESLQQKIGENARQYILRNYSMDRVLNMELDVIREVIAQ